MNSVITSEQVSAPHLLQNSHHSPGCSFLSHTNTMIATRKRKAGDEVLCGDMDDRMTSASPSTSPLVSSRSLPTTSHRHQVKRSRSNISGRPLVLSRLLETLGVEEMRELIQSLSERHADIGNELVAMAPRPSVASVMEVLKKYESTFHESFPFGNRPCSDYAHNRVRQPLISMLDAIRDYTTQFLPPTESQVTVSLNYLDGVTGIIHRVPNWDSCQYNRYKQDAYEDLSKAWALVIREAGKRAGGIQIQRGGWDEKVSKHNEISEGKMVEAISEVSQSLEWMAGLEKPTFLEPRKLGYGLNIQ